MNSVIQRITVDEELDELIGVQSLKDSGKVVSTGVLYRVGEKQLYASHFVQNNGTKYIVFEDGSRIAVKDFVPVQIVESESPETDVVRGRVMREIIQGGRMAVAGTSYSTDPDLSEQDKNGIRDVKRSIAHLFGKLDYHLVYNSTKDSISVIMTPKSLEKVRANIPSILLQSNLLANERTTLDRFLIDAEFAKNVGVVTTIFKPKKGKNNPDEVALQQLFDKAKTESKKNPNQNYQFENRTTKIIRSTAGTLTKPSEVDIRSNKKPKYRLLSEFVEEQQKKTSSIRFHSDIVRDQLNGMPVLYKYFTVGGVTGKLIVRTRPINEGDSVSMVDELETDIARIEALGTDSSQKEFMTALGETWLIRVLRNNASLTTKASSPIGTDLRNWGIRVASEGSGKFKFYTAEGKQHWTVEKENFIRIASSLIDGWNTDFAKNFKMLYQPYSVGSFTSNTISETRSAPLYVDYDDIQTPTVYADITDFIDSKPSQGTGDITDLGGDDPIRNAFGPAFNEKPIRTSYPVEEKRIQNAEQMVAALLGREKDNKGKNRYSLELVRGEDALQHEGKVLYGMLNGTHIQLEDFYGVEQTTPRHEVHHFVFYYGLTPKAQQRLLKETRILTNRPDMTLSEAGEYLARDYGSEYQGKEIQKKDPWYTPSGLLQRYRAFLDHVLMRWGLYRPTIESLKKAIEQGEFANVEFNIEQANLRVETMAKNIDDEEESVENIESFEARRGSAAVIDVLKKSFDLKDLPNIHNRVSAMLNNFSPYTLLKGITPSETMGEMISKTFEGIKGYLDDNKKPIDPKRLVTVNGRQVTLDKLTTADYMLLPKGSLDKREYILYKLQDAETFDAMVSHIFPDYRFDKGKIKNWSAEVYDERSRTDPNTVRSGLLKWQYSITPRYSYDIFGNRINKVHDGASYVGNMAITSYLGKAMDRVTVSLRSQGYVYGGEPVSPKVLIDTLIAELKSQAVKFSSRSKTRDTILSFINHWLMSDDASGNSFYERYLNNEIDSQIRNTPQAKAISDLFMAFLNDSWNLVNRKQTDSKIVTTKDGSYRIITTDRVSDPYIDNSKAIKTAIVL
jgi:hypothetical protein